MYTFVDFFTGNGWNFFFVCVLEFPPKLHEVGTILWNLNEEKYVFREIITRRWNILKHLR